MKRNVYVAAIVGGALGLAEFTNGKPSGEEVHRTCFSCHAPAKARDYVFTQYAP